MESFYTAFSLIFSADPALYAIIRLSLAVSLTATALAALIGIPLGTLIAMARFRGRDAVIVLISAMMALPPVVGGLIVYLLLSRAGPLGAYGLLYTPQAMVIAQTLLITPIIASLSREAVAPLERDYRSLFAALGTSGWLRFTTVMRDARFALLTAVLAGLGRALAEVGAVLIVGGNINGVTRVMTTTIALETSRGNLGLALALGLVLIVLAIALNALIYAIGQFGRRYQQLRG